MSFALDANRVRFFTYTTDLIYQTVTFLNLNKCGTLLWYASPICWKKRNLLQNERSFFYNFEYWLLINFTPSMRIASCVFVCFDLSISFFVLFYNTLFLRIFHLISLWLHFIVRGWGIACLQTAKIRIEQKIRPLFVLGFYPVP